jgi:hypothetical protein
MLYQNDRFNSAKQFILSQVNVSASAEQVPEENTQLDAKKTEIVNNSTLSAENKKLKLGELLTTQEKDTESVISGNTLWSNGSIPENRNDAKAQLFSNIAPLMPDGYLFGSVNNLKIQFKIITISTENISNEEKKYKIHQLLNEIDPLISQTTVHEAVTSTLPDLVANHDNLLNNSSSLNRESRASTFVMTSGGHRTVGGILRKLFDPFIWLYEKLQQADRLVVTGYSEVIHHHRVRLDEELTKMTSTLDNQYNVTQASVRRSEIQMPTSALFSANQSFSQTGPEINWL